MKCIANEFLYRDRCITVIVLNYFNSHEFLIIFNNGMLALNIIASFSIA